MRSVNFSWLPANRTWPSANERALNISMTAVIRTTIYLADMDDFQSVNAIYARHLGDHRPARSTVAVKGLPLGARIEIDMMAVKP